MNPSRRLAWCFRSLPHLAILAAVGFLLVFPGCRRSTEVDDPQLRPIQAALNNDLPMGTTQNAVAQYLATRGYPTEPADKPGTLVAIIRHIDREKLQPVTARVTFHFDPNGKLNETELVRTFNRNTSE